MKIDEAKRLRDEINGIIADMVCDNQSSELTEEIINKMLDVAISAAENERLTDDTGDPSDTAYESAIDCVTLAINKLRP